MKSLFKNTRLYKWIAQIFNSWIDVFSFAIDKMLSGLFGGLFLLTLVLLLSTMTTQAQPQTPYTKLLKSERSPYDTAVAIEIRTYRIETYKIRFADTVIDSLSNESKSLQKELNASRDITNLQAVNIAAQGEQLKNSEVRWTELNNNYQQIFKLIQEKDEPEKWYQNKYLWIGAAFVSGVLIAR